MISASMGLPGSYDCGDVARSVLIAIAASYAGLDVAGRVNVARGRARLVWLSGGALVMGIGIWLMHMKGVLAYHLPVPMEYHWPTALAAILLAIFASALALYVSSRQKLGWIEALRGSIVMGAGIAGLHYISMAAMRLPAIPRYSPLLVICSILLAVLFSFIALVMAFDLREETRWSIPRRAGSAIVMGAAVSAMHYTGMAAVIFFPGPPPDLSHAISVTPIGDSGVVTATLLVLAAALITSSVDRRSRAEVQRLNENLERRVAERTFMLELVNQALRKEVVERKRAEDDVRRSEGHLRLVIDTIPAQIWSGPADGSLDFCNEQWRSYTGLTLDEIQGEGWRHMLHPDDRERVLNAWSESVANGTPYEQEERHRGFDKQYRWFLARGVPLRNPEGIILRWYGTNTDIQERKEAEKQLRLIVDTTPAMLYSARPDGDLDFFNKRWLDYLGSSLEDLQGWQWTATIHPEDLEDLVRKWRLALATGEPYEAEARVRQSDGQYRWMLLRKVALRDQAGNIVRWYGSGIDIEDRKRAEEELRASEEKYRVIVKTASDSVISIDESGTILLANPATERIFGCDPSKLIGKPLTVLVPEVMRRVHEAGLRRYLTTGQRHMNWEGTEVTGLRQNGEEFRAEVSFGEVISSGQRMFTGFIRDISEKKRAEEQLRHAQEDLNRVARVVVMGELAAAIAHQVNQPLGAVVTNAGAALRWLMAQPPNLQEALEAIERTVREASRASEVIARIRALLQKGPAQMERLDVNAVIREVLILACSELWRDGILVRRDLAPDLPAVFGDRIQLQQVLWNLIRNAVEAMSTNTDRRRELAIKSERHQAGVVIQVQDSGEGIDPEHAGQVFEPFFTTKPEGIGIGLSVGRSIIEAHGGRLWFTPGPSHGAVFQFTVPEADTSDERAA
jgi:PAS domain S-box-containing protein